eukprot:jgi/Undpi1/14188/HiC_scaffold_9.g03837.m1
MADASMLQGYLMKEKSKMSLLHGLTGDINKRYFRVRTIEGGDELALCYYKNIADPVVRGWIYLKDMTEIAEIQDTIILTSVARTLYLYAQTRAEHNLWVTGLAKLCPEAFVKLRRNAPAQKEMSDGPSIISRTSPRNEEAKGSPNEYVRTRDKNASQHGRHRGAEKRIAKKDDGFGDAGIEYSRTAGGKGRDGTGLQNNERSMDKRDIQLHVERSRDDMSNDVSGSDGGDRECGKKTISRDVERVESRGIQPTGAGDADTAGAADRQFDTVDDKKSSPPDHGCETSVPLRAGSSENENVETIELNESVGHDCTAGGLRDRKGMIGHAQQGIDGAALENELKRSNQHGEREFDEEAENDILVPQLEIVDWEGPRQGQSVTSRLHRHISGENDLEALGSVNAILPPPKEFLASRPLKSSPRTQGEVESKHKPGGHGMECLELENGLKNGLKPAKKGRRTSAADVEWSDGAEARDQLRQFDDKISTLTDYGPVNLGDSDDDDDEEEDFDIEIEKQRRRANAAILALETAAKEADEDAQADVREDSDCKRPCEKIRKKPANAHRERCVPSPTGPPPAGAPRNGRRGQGVPRPRIAPPKLASHTRSKQASHWTEPNAASDNIIWDEIKTPCHGSPTMGSRGPGGLPAAVGASETATSSGVDRDYGCHREQLDD